MSSYVRPLEDAPRCKKWQLVITRGSRGDRRCKTKVFNGGKREALAALKDFEQDTALPLVSTSFYGFATKWNNLRYESGAIAQETYEKYYWHIGVFSHYLNKTLEDITPHDIAAAYAAIRGSRDWSGTTMRGAHQSLVRIFRAAKDEGLIKESPMLGVDAPRLDTGEKRALTPMEAKTLLDKLNPTENQQLAVSLILRCGLRRGEVCGLEWRDIEDVIHVRRDNTKSNAGVRDIPLDEETVDMLEKRRQLVSSYLEAVGDKLRPGDKVVCGLDGRPLTKNALRLWWNRHRANYGLDGWTLHELRHTFLTNLAQAGVHPSVMKKLAGHASMQTTMLIYTHVHNEDAKDAISALNDLRCAAKCAADEIGNKTGQTQTSI